MSHCQVSTPKSVVTGWFLTVDRTFGTSISPTRSKSSSYKPFPLMLLPFELRAKILQCLLPDEPSIDFSLKRPGSRNIHRYRRDNDNCYTAVLRINRQLYEEGTRIVYNREIVMTERMVKFWKVPWTDPEAASAHTPVFPFHKAKQLTIQAGPSIFPAGGWGTYVRLIHLCAYIHRCSPSLRRVHLLFWEKEPGALKQPAAGWLRPLQTQIGLPDRSFYPIFTSKAWDLLNNSSTLEMLLQPLARLPQAEMYTIEVIAQSTRSRSVIQSVQTLNEQYSAGIVRQRLFDMPGILEAYALGSTGRRLLDIKDILLAIDDLACTSELHL